MQAAEPPRTCRQVPGRSRVQQREVPFQPRQVSPRPTRTHRARPRRGWARLSRARPARVRPTRPQRRSATQPTRRRPQSPRTPLPSPRPRPVRPVRPVRPTQVSKARVPAGQVSTAQVPMRAALRRPRGIRQVAPSPRCRCPSSVSARLRPSVPARRAHPAAGLVRSGPVRPRRVPLTWSRPSLRKRLRVLGSLQRSVSPAGETAGPSPGSSSASPHGSSPRA